MKMCGNTATLTTASVAAEHSCDGRNSVVEVVKLKFTASEVMTLCQNRSMHIVITSECSIQVLTCLKPSRL